MICVDRVGVNKAARENDLCPSVGPVNKTLQQKNCLLNPVLVGNLFLKKRGGALLDVPLIFATTGTLEIVF